MICKLCGQEKTTMAHEPCNECGQKTMWVNCQRCGIGTEVDSEATPMSKFCDRCLELQTAERAQLELCELVGAECMVDWPELVGRVKFVLEEANDDATDALLREESNTDSLEYKLLIAEDFDRVHGLIKEALVKHKESNG